MPGQHPSRIELLPAAREQHSVLENLLELYIHDFSEFFAVGLGPDGRFRYPNVEIYWADPNRFPFLVHVDGRLAGFVLIARSGNGPDGDPLWDIAEFFVARGFRRRGIGMRIASEVWRRFPGRWQVRVMESNQPACSFWRRAIEGYLGAPVDPSRIEHHGLLWRVFLFQTPPPFIATQSP
jgi:predicted acetyltransferase